MITSDFVVLLIVMLTLSLHAGAAPPVFEINIRDHLFYPDQLVIPSGVKVKLIVNNNDPTPEEFESYELNREKVILGGRKGIVFCNHQFHTDGCGGRAIGAYRICVHHLRH